MINGIKHIAFIMDGNGRWAKKRLMPREFGHKAGAEKFKEILNYCKNIDIDIVTVYAFSTENWKRPQNEVNSLMQLFEQFTDDAMNSQEPFRVIFIGDRSVMNPDLIEKMNNLEKKTEKNSKTVCIALNYGGRAEIVNAVNTLISQGKKNITEDDITSTIYSGKLPPPDMIVRTGGEYRLSNFLMWQSSYSELFFTNTLWPDLKTEEIDEMITEFTGRKRRFGGI